MIMKKKSLEELEIKRKNRDPTDHSISQIGSNTQKSPGDVWRLTKSQTTVKDRQLMLVWETRHNE